MRVHETRNKSGDLSNKRIGRIAAAIDGIVRKGLLGVAVALMVGTFAQAQEVKTAAPKGYVDVEAVDEHMKVAGDSPVVVLNVIKFKSAEHAEQFRARSRETTGPHLQKIGGKVLYAGAAGPEFSEGDDWDLVILVQYPSFAAFHQIAVGDEIGRKVLQIRDDTIQRAQLLLTIPANGPQE